MQHSTDPRSRRQIVLIGGYAGSGKSELGRILAALTSWPLLDKDTISRPVVEAALTSLGLSGDDRESPTYLEVIRPAEYECLLDAMRENLECGNSAIVVAPFLRELPDRAWCEELTATAGELRADLHVIWVRCDLASMRMYLEQRDAPRDKAKLADWGAYTARIDLNLTVKLPHSVIQNSLGSLSLHEQAISIRTVLRPG